MKTKIITSFIFLFFVFSFISVEQSKIKVACIGDSITDGDGLKDRSKEAYPAILSSLLGNKYDVVNFGKSGATVLKNGDWPYWEKPAFKEALEFNPNIVIILLGANDSKPQNIPSHKGKFINDLRAMVDSFASLPSRPRIYLCKPVPAFPNRFNISDSILVTDVLPAINKVAKEKRCKVIDLHSKFSKNPEYFPDGVHPDKSGAIAIANYISKFIKKQI